MAEKDINLQISGDETGLVASLNRAQEAVKASSEQMKAHMEKFSAGVQSVQKTFIAFTAVLLGGEAIKKLTEQAADWNVQALKMSKQLGISTEEASVYMVAMKHLGIDTAVLTDASTKMSKQLFTHADAFERLGIVTKTANGHFRPAADLIGEVNSKLVAIKNPIERNIEGIQLYGKGWQEIRPLLKLTSEEFSEAETRAKALGLIVGPEGAERAHKYELAMNDLKLVGQSLSTQMGQSLLPTFTSIGIAAADAAPKVSEVFGSAIKFVAGIAIDLGAGMGELGTRIGGLLAAAGAAVHGDFAGARGILKDMEADIAEIEKKADAMKAKMSAPLPKGERPDIGGDDPSIPPPVPKQSQMPGFETELAQTKAKFETEEGFRQFSLSQERDYWQQVLQTNNLSASDKLSIKRKVAEAEVGIAKQGFQAEIEALKVQESEYKNNADKRLEIAQQEAARMKSAYGADSKEYQQEALHVVEIEREKQQQLRQIANTHSDTVRKQAMLEVDMDEEAARLAVELGTETNVQLAEQMMQFEQRKFAIQMEGLQQRKDLIDPEHDPVAYEEACSQIEMLEANHQANISKIKGQTVVATMATQMQLQSTLQSGFQQTLTKFVAGSATIAQTMKSLLNNITQATIQMLTQLMAKKLAMHAAEMIMGKKEMLMAAAHAAINAAKSAAQIPFVGWALAIGAGAAVFAGMKALASASSGYDIPAGVNPVTQLHEREMVLPAKHADVIRGLSEGQGGQQGGDTHNWHISTMDSSSFKEFANQNRDHIAGALTAAFRNGYPVPR